MSAKLISKKTCRCEELPVWPIDRQRENEFLNHHFVGAVFGTAGFIAVMGVFLLLLWFGEANPLKWSIFGISMVFIFWGALLIAYVIGCVWLFAKIICPCCGGKYILNLRYSRKYREQCASCGHPGLHNV